MKSDSHTTKLEYVKRINSVLDFIEKHLEADLSLEVLSKVACYSSFHFHRVFTTIVGENLNQYVNRKRIERVASILLTGYEKPIKELAYVYGFNSESSFSRSFKKYYGISPTKFKLEGKDILSKIGIELFSTENYICDIDNMMKWMDMNAQIVVRELQEINLAGMMRIGEFHKIGEMYRRLMDWGHQKKVLDMDHFRAVTIYHDNPNVTHISKVRYSACVTVNQPIPIEGEGDIRPLTTGGGVYVVARFEIAGEYISEAWKNLNVWVLENGYEFRDSDFFEIYHNDHQTHPEQKFILDICIPIEKTGNVILNKSYGLKASAKKPGKASSNQQLSYHELIDRMKEIRAFFEKTYEPDFKPGNIYRGSPEYSYFSITTEGLKKQKLKFVIVLDHRRLDFSICLSGQNKSVRKKYWNMFKNSDWNKYRLVESIENSLPIIEHPLTAAVDFSNMQQLIAKIESEAMKFINDLRAILE